MLRTLRLVPAALLLAAGFTATACAAPLYGQRGGYRNVDPRAYDTGYREGFRQGENDARRGRDHSYTRHGEYRSADDGYRRAGGDREFYRRSFRQGFQNGYDDGYRRSVNTGRNQRYPTYPSYPTPNPNYPGDRGVRRDGYSQATQIGYRDGFEAGRDDARDRRRYDPVRTKRYREGDHDYNNRYGNREDYKREYRNAFTQGYRDGYEGRRGF